MHALSTIAVLLPLVGCSSGAPATPEATPTAAAPSPTSTSTHQVTGTLTLRGTPDSVALTFPGCFGTDGYSDVVEGAPVTVKDQASIIVATGRLGPGAQIEHGHDCAFPVVVDGVPDTATFYAIDVSHRGALTFSHDDIAAKDWKVALSLGGP